MIAEWQAVEDALGALPASERPPFEAASLSALCHLAPAGAVPRLAALPDEVATLVLRQAASEARLPAREIGELMQSRMGPRYADWTTADIALAAWAGLDGTEAKMGLLDPVFDGWRVVVFAIDSGRGKDWASAEAWAVKHLGASGKPIDRARLALLRARPDAGAVEATELAGRIDDATIRMEAVFELAVRAKDDAGQAVRWAEMAREAAAASPSAGLEDARRAAIQGRSGPASEPWLRALGALDAASGNDRVGLYGDLFFAAASLGAEAVRAVFTRLDRDGTLSPPRFGELVYQACDALRYVRAETDGALSAASELMRRVGPVPAGPAVLVALIDVAQRTKARPADVWLAALRERLTRLHTVAGAGSSLPRAARTLGTALPEAARNVGDLLQDPVHRAHWRIGLLRSLLDTPTEVT